MATGVVKWFNGTKGYGFIKPDDGSADVFVHISAVVKAGFKTLMENQRIGYDIEDNKGKKAAGNLRLLQE
jgi:CspA family cold shock protein